MVTHRILVVEDNPSISVQLVRGLRAAGFDAELAADGHAGKQRALSGGFDLVLLDLNLPGPSGLEILEACQSRLSTPVLVLTARTDLDTRLASFRLGAADYVSKPFFLEEIVARIRARLRLTEDVRRTLTWANAEADFDARTVCVDHRDIELTAVEFNVLATLLERPDRPVSRGQLVRDALPAEADSSERTVDSHVARIRKKLGPEAAAAIQTVWRVGYRFRPGEGT